MIRDGVVENVVSWDGSADTWRPPTGYTLVEADGLSVGVGWLWDGSAFTIPAPPTIDLAQVKQDAIALINDEAEKQRLHYITPGAGQAMTYLEKAAQAESIINGEAPDPNKHTLIFAEAEVTGQLPAVVATVIKNRYDAWKVIGSLIEKERRRLIIAVENASDVSQVSSATQSAEWPS